MLGLPAYLVGYIFIYFFMEGLFTRVTFTLQNVHHPTPGKIFPLLLTTTKLEYVKIENITLNITDGI